MNLDPSVIRLWVRSQGEEIGERGRIKEITQARYVKAGMPTREQILEAHPELRPTSAPAEPIVRHRQPQEPRQGDGEAGVAPEASEAENVAQIATQPRAGRKVILPHHYDARPTLFSADAMLVQRHARITPTRALWTVADMEQCQDVFGEPSNVPRMAGIPAVSDPLDSVEP